MKDTILALLGFVSIFVCILLALVLAPWGIVLIEGSAAVAEKFACSHGIEAFGPCKKPLPERTTQ